MGFVYPDTAVQQAFALYLKFNGGQHDRIEAEMRKEWPAWSKQNLHNRGSKIGWIEKYNWTEALRQHRETITAASLPTAERIAYQIDQVRDALFLRGQARGWDDRDLVYQYEHYARLSIESHQRLREARETPENAVQFWEFTLEILAEIAPDVWKKAITPEITEAMLGRLKERYGETTKK